MSKQSVLQEVSEERDRQDSKWGPQDHPDGTNTNGQDGYSATMAKEICQRSFDSGIGTWRDILYEETCEAYAESDPLKLRNELLQVAAVAVAWIEAIDRREYQS